MRNIFVALVLVLFVGCSSDDISTSIPTEFIDFSAENDLEIQTFLEANNLEAERSDTGLYYIIDNPGEGSNPVATDNVTVAYRGYFTNGATFDQSVDGISFDLQNVIAGWTEGIPFFKEGGSGVLLIPSALGYGNLGLRGVVPGGAVIIFDVEVISIN